LIQSESEGEPMARFKVGAAVAASAFAAALACAGPASADTPDIDSPCAGHDLGRSATATNGKTVVCIADDSGRLTWMLDGGAASTIAGLQAQGYTVTIEQLGDDPLSTCTVVQVHNAMTTTRRLGSGGTIGGGTGSLGDHHASTIEVTKTIDVQLDCTGHG